MIATDDLLYTIRGSDLVVKYKYWFGMYIVCIVHIFRFTKKVQKIVKSDKGNKLQVVKTLEGRGPLCRIPTANKLCLLNREGRDIQVVEDNGHDFPLVTYLEVRYPTGFALYNPL